MIELIYVKSVIALWVKSIELAAEILKSADDDILQKSFNITRIMRDTALTISLNIREGKRKKRSEDVVFSLAVVLSVISEIEGLIVCLDDVLKLSITEHLSEMRYSIINIIPEILKNTTVTD